MLSALEGLLVAK